MDIRTGGALMGEQRKMEKALSQRERATVVGTAWSAMCRRVRDSNYEILPIRILKAGRSRVRFPMASFEFFIDIILPAVLCPGIDSSSNRDEYQEYFLGSKGGRCVGLTTLPISCAGCLGIGELHPPGTLRACPGL